MDWRRHFQIDWFADFSLFTRLEKSLLMNRFKCKWLATSAITVAFLAFMLVEYSSFRSPRKSWLTPVVECSDENAKAYYLSTFVETGDRDLANEIVSVATSCYVFDGGSYSGERWFWTCTLKSEDMCFRLLSRTPFHTRLPKRPTDLSEMVQYSKDELLQGMIGPLQFQFDESAAASRWFPHLVERGCYFLMTEGDRYYMFLIDLDRCRVYECYQS